MPNFYPFDSAEIMKKQKSLKRQLIKDESPRIKTKIAVLSGSTVDGIVDVLDLFLLWRGIEASFYKSEYNQYWQDAMFGEALREFKPDFIFIHTSGRNILKFPEMNMGENEISELAAKQLEHFSTMWDKLREDIGCPIIQNNIEPPYWRLLGNKDCADPHGRVSFVDRLNRGFYDYAVTHNNFFIHDINYLSAVLGLHKWSDPLYWNMYKYALAVPFIPDFAFSLSKIFASLLGKNKKALALDLDNTLWGGVIGDDGTEGIAIGNEIPMGQVYREFQEYIKAQKQLGVLLTVCSKNDYENAIAGLNHPDGVLKPEDFTIIKANWEPKSINIEQTAQELNLLPESFVFIDDNPAEREIVRASLSVETPPMNNPESYINIIDMGGYFEITNFSDDDLKRGEMYKQNAQREKAQSAFSDYGEYLNSLEMTAEITDFSQLTLARITQLTNKSNQFNVTTKRLTPSDTEQIFNSPDYIRLCGRLKDKFGDNGIVSVVIGKKQGEELNVELWLMSCRVLKREMEYAMLDVLVEKAKENKISIINANYYPTSKNSMVKNLFADFGFDKTEEDAEGNTKWRLEIKNYKNKTLHINIAK